jgi:hypothetical protein
MSAPTGTDICDFAGSSPSLTVSALSCVTLVVAETQAGGIIK